MPSLLPLRCFGLLLSILTPLLAQDNSPDKPKGGSIKVSLLAEAVPDNLGQVFLAEEKTKSEPLALPTNRLSAPVSVATRVMVLKAVEKETPLCTINLPETGKSFAVVLVIKKDLSGFSPIVVRTDDPDFKAGDVFFINRSEKTVLGKLGTSPLVLKPGETKKDRPSGAVDDTYYNILFGTRDADGEKMLCSTRWPIDNQLRTYLFFFTNAQGKTTFRGVDEYLPPVAPAP